MPTTPNLQFQRPTHNSFVDTWDTPVNQNWDSLDSAIGGTAVVGLTNSPVTLSAGQYANGFITFTGTLTGDVAVTFPPYGRVYWLQNNCAANTTFKVTCLTTAASPQYVALPPNEAIQVLCDGTNMKFVGLGRVGTYWDFGGSAVPIWVTGSNPQPYLNCNGATFSSVTFPALAAYLGGTTLPDARGRFRATLNQTTGRLTGSSSLGGVNGDTLIASGGTQALVKANLPNYALTVTDTGHTHGSSVTKTINNTVTDPGHTHAGSVASHTHTYSRPFNNVFVAAGADWQVMNDVNTQLTSATAPAVTINSGVTGLTVTSSLTVGVSVLSNTTGIAVNSGGSGSGFAPPSYIGGLTLIRAG